MTAANHSNKIYFSGLNGLRFFAASAVIFHHVEQHKYWIKQPNIWNTGGLQGAFIDALGHEAVSFFFVLSGFLITYLLLAEIQKTGTVALKKFYVRRILRIWPLYYVVVMVAIFVLPYFNVIDNWDLSIHDNFSFVLLIHVFMLPNLMLARPFHLVGANQAWSVGVEEQFYIIWPVLVRKYYKRFLLFLAIFIGIKMLIGAIAMSGAHMLAIDNRWGKLFAQFDNIWSQLKMEQMAVGAWGAYYLFSKNEQFLKWIYSKLNIGISSILFISLFLVPFDFFGATLVEAYVFLSLILNISTNKDFPLKLENRLFNLLGNMSYGIYMWHTICISVLLTLFVKMELPVHTIWYQVLLYISSFLLTLLVSYLSYTYMETFFLRFKDRFMVVKSSSKVDN